MSKIICYSDLEDKKGFRINNYKKARYYLTSVTKFYEHMSCHDSDGIYADIYCISENTTVLTCLPI